METPPVDEAGVGVIAGLVTAAALIAVNAFFVAAEFALVAVRRSRVEHLAAKGSTAAKTLQRTLKDLDRYIAGTQVGITIASIGLGFVGETVLAEILLAALAFVPIQLRELAAHAIATTVAFLLLTTGHVVLGELVPKSLALRDPERLALAIVRPLRAIVMVLSPFVFVLNGLGNGMLKLLRLPAPKSHSITPDELRYVVEQAEESGVIAEHAADVVRGALRFPHTLVRQVMVHRRDVEALDANLAPEELWRAAVRCKHSRIPVYRRELDKIVGVLHVKDLLKHDPATFDLGAVVRPPLWVTSDTPIPDLVASLRRKRTRIALVTDEFGGFFGLVTLEDAAEVVLGEVLDEHDVPKQPIAREPDGRFVATGSMRLLDLQEALDHEFEERAVTVGGFLMRHLGRLPESGERVSVEGFDFDVESVTGTQIGRVRVAPVPALQAEETDGAA